jgi:hypothetical protein
MMKDMATNRITGSFKYRPIRAEQHRRMFCATDEKRKVKAILAIDGECPNPRNYADTRTIFNNFNIFLNTVPPCGHIF